MGSRVDSITGCTSAVITPDRGPDSSGGEAIMRHSLTCAFIQFGILGSTVASAQTWESAPTIPTGGQPRTFAAGVNHQGTLYAIGGTPWQNGGDMDGSVHALPPGGGAWTVTAPLAGLGPVVSQAAGVDSLGRIVVYGGFILNDDGPGGEETYDPIEGPSGGVASRPAPASATGYCAWARDEQGYLYGIGGGPGEGGPNIGYSDRYDAALNVWQTIAPMPTPAADATAACDGVGHVLVFGGINATGDTRLANVAQYDVGSGTWSDTAIPDMPVELSGARAARGIDGRIYVAGGETGPIGAGVTQITAYKLDLASNTWSPVAGMSTPRKHFAFVLGDDDYLYAIGGENGTGGTDQVEKLFTPRCPSFTIQPQDLTAWSGTIAGFSVNVTGASPLTYQWRRDGQPLNDGPTGTGSSIGGATTASLAIDSPGQADAGSYDCLAENACGSTLSAVAVLTIRQTPSIPSQWTVTNIHPSWAESSSVAFCVSGGRIGGEANTPTLLPDGRTLTLAHPVLWSGPNWANADLTPAGSIGGGIRDIGGDYLVGWFWHIYSCYSGGQWWTCGWQSAAYWNGEPPAFTEAPHGSGPEYDFVNATDGQRMVGTLTYEYTEGVYTSYAYLWTPPSSGVSLHPPAGASNSGASAIDGEYQYGSITTPYPGPTVHAARWSGSAASFVDLHPAGFTRSWVSGAGDGQPVGSAYAGDTPHAVLWAGGSGATIDLTPPGFAASAVDATGGLQVGTAGGHAAVWAGSAASFVDLTAWIPADFSSATAEGVDVSPDGTVTIVGHGYVPSRSRTEALVWQSIPGLPGDMNCDGVLDLLDIQPFATALVDAAAYSAAFPDCDLNKADMSANGAIDGADIAPFVNEVLP